MKTLIPKEIKNDFPIFKRKIHGKSLVYLDSASSSQKPKQVIEALSNYYEKMHANIHRGIYTLSEEATLAYEDAHRKVARLINAKFKEIIFTTSMIHTTLSGEGSSMVEHTMFFVQQE